MWDEIAAESDRVPDVTWDKILVDAITSGDLSPYRWTRSVATNRTPTSSPLAAALAG